jgi:lactobin A/cerein 7B family class IIb bacteriocin
MNAQTLDRQDFETTIIQRSWSDEAFRKGFTANPESAFAKPANVDLELSDADLEKVAGGATPVSLVSLVVTVVAGTAGSGVSASAIVTVDRGW